MRTTAAVAWEAAARYHCLYLLALSLLDGGCCSSVNYGSTGCCSSTYVLLQLLLLLQALQQYEEVMVHRKPSDRVVGGG